LSQQQLRVNPEYEKILPKIPKEEFKALKHSIQTEGQHFPITANPDLEILDGHHRFRACKELGIEPKFEVRFFPNKLLEKKFVIESNLRRRHLNRFERIELAYPLLEIEKELVKERLENRPRNDNGRFQPCDENSSHGRATERIAEKIGLSHDIFEKGIKIIESAPSDLKEKVREEKVSISSAYNILTKKPEQEGFEPKVFTVWNFTNCDDRFGVPNFPGRIPGQIVQNILHYYTSEGDLVVDPMAGSGTTLDVCKLMDRNCLCYDVAPIREDIKKHDIKEGFPQEVKHCNLIFIDPPYYKKLQGKYDRNSISELPKEQFLEFISKLAKDCHDVLSLDGIVALLISDYVDDKNSLLTCEYYNLFKQVGFTPINRIQVPLTTDQYARHEVDRAKEQKTMLNITRDLYIFRK